MILLVSFTVSAKAETTYEVNEADLNELREITDRLLVLNKELSKALEESNSQLEAAKAKLAEFQRELDQINTDLKQISDSSKTLEDKLAETQELLRKTNESLQKFKEMVDGRIKSLTFQRDLWFVAAVVGWVWLLKVSLL
ncbi:MAG TPA: hypothetical protein VHY08_10295 [Bacillota bacterium]|nr:hypothetical protein [Bacillota bacterium]